MLSCTKKVLPNGLRLVSVEMPHLHSAEIAIYIKAGGRNDTPGKAGISHFLEHMLFRGSSEFASNLELEIAFEAIGGSVNAATDEETTCYFSRVHPEQIAEGVRLFSSMLLTPTLEGLEIEKRIITEEALEDINERGEETNTSNLCSRLLWPDHPLGTPTIGFLESIKGITEEDLRRYLADHYVPGNALVVAAGRHDPAQFFEACERYFAGWSGGAAIPPVPANQVQQEPCSLFVKDSDSQVNLQIAFRGFARQDKRLMGLRLIRRILSGGGSSRLHLSLREKLGIVYSVDASLSAYEETGAFAIELATAPENLVLAVSEVLREVKSLAFEEVGEAELARVKEGYFYDLEYSADSTYEMQVRYGWGELMSLIRSIDEDRAEAAAVGAEELKHTAHALFAPKNLVVAAVGPWKAPAKRAVEKLIREYRKAWASF
ncbi:insulinase family protein [Geomonas subterranea]|uniref:Insulinase family protein n=1 Tax=Geomonas subterranea TaxID=2847989 RepID=A0ABX8LGM1_9BACT|nr:pitrilysin family protein [Geomonas subterranea]QXE90491.1 insulinase family protein [Geomonas subterranea]QXM11432.1 insulinase family protein [Geomonas subterranea]